MVRNTSIDTVTQVSINFRKHQKENKKMVTNTEHNTEHTYDEYGNKCVNMEGEGNAYECLDKYTELE